MNKLLASLLALTSSLFLVTSVSAQDQAGASPEDDQAPVEDVLEEVTVTGSRIKRSGYTAPTPVTMATSEDLLKIQPTNLPDALNKLPQFQLSGSPTKGNHNWARDDLHGNLLNLRSVGPIRTLILLDGMRLAPTNSPGTVDTNVIPNLLVDRIEIVTGGASAAYGSDAVAGVVNFVINEDYTGIKGVAQGGIDGEGDNGNYRFALAGGFDFADERGHLLLSAETFKTDGMLRSDRAAGAAGYIWGGLGTESNPFRIADNATLNFASDLGKIVAGPAGFPYVNYEFLPGGTGVKPWDNGEYIGHPVWYSGGDGFAIPYDTTASMPFDNTNLYGRAQFEFTDSITGYLYGIYSQTNMEYTNQANALIGATPATLFAGNPYLPDEVQAALEPGQSITVGNYHWGPDRQMPQYANDDVEYYTIAAGLEGSFGADDNWFWRASFSTAKADHTTDQHNTYHYARAYAALDAVVDPATGDIVCYPSLSSDPEIAARYADCKPINLVGGDPSVQSPEGYAYATGTSATAITNDMDIFAATVSGPVFDLPAGPMDLAFGVEYRQESLDITSNSDPVLLSTPEQQAAHYAGLRGVPAGAMSQFYWFENWATAHGDRDVTEGFVEVNLPVVADRPGFRQLDLNAAYRYTDYSTSGSVDTWKVGLIWRPTDSVMLRGTVSTDIRAPSLRDLFQGQQIQLGFLTHPNGEAGNYESVSGGNLNLKPEEADTLTMGVVITPESVEGLSLSIDYYSIDISGAIDTPGVTTIVNNCYNSQGTAPECDVIEGAWDEFPSRIYVVPINVASIKTSGIDFDASYATEAGPGFLNLRLYANYLLKYEEQRDASRPVYSYEGIAFVDNALMFGRPELSATLNAQYLWNNWNFAVSEQFIDSMTIDRPGLPNVFENNHVGTVWYTDLTVSYDLEAWNGQFQLFATVNNLFDKTPPLIPAIIPGASYPTLINVYDYIGRAFTVGTRFDFD